MIHTYSGTVAPNSPIRLDHLRTLRQNIDFDLNAASRSYPWTWTAPTQPAPVLAKYFKEMREAIQVLWDAKARGPLPAWSGAAPGGESTGTTQTRIRASHITDLRSWLYIYETNYPPNAQGVSSLWYDPPSGNIISNTQGNDWTSNIKALSAHRLFVRLNFISPKKNATETSDFNSTDFQTALANFKTALLQYKNQAIGTEEMRPFVILITQFYWKNGEAPQDTLNSDPSSVNYFTNSYIRNFAAQAQQLRDWSVANGVPIRDFIVWNEPNDSNPEHANKYFPYTSYDPGQTALVANFAALVARCWRTLVTSDNGVSVYWGGIYTNDNEHIGSQIDYVRAVYQACYDFQAGGKEYGQFPWSGINVHAHFSRSQALIDQLFGDINDIRYGNAEKEIEGWGDWKSLIVGEWGVVEANGPLKLEELFNRIKDYPDIMFYWSHHRVIEGSLVWGLITGGSASGGVYQVGNNTQLWTKYQSLLDGPPPS